MSRLHAAPRQRFAMRAISHSLLLSLVTSPLLSSIAAAQTVQNTTSSYQYDAAGNLIQSTDPLQRVSNQSYDALHRVQQQTQPAPLAGAARPVIGYSYDGADQLVKVTDPRLLATSYGVDGLGNVNSLLSPDTKDTTNTYDASGNLKTSKDARGLTTTYSYDVLNRLTKISYASGTASAFGYDSGNYAKGKLSSFTDESGSTSYLYNSLGRLTTQTQNTGGKVFVLGYGYGSVGGATGKRSSITYPSGNQINYHYDDAGQLISLDLNTTNANGQGTNTSVVTPVLNNIHYGPFAGPLGWDWGNSNIAPNPYNKTTDLDGRIVSYPLGHPAANGSIRTLHYDAASRIINTTHTGSGTGANLAANLDQTYGYDNLDRITSATSTSSNTLSQGFQYDASGNRTQVRLGSSTYSNTVAATSNQLSNTSGPLPAKTMSYSPSGSLLADGKLSATYSDRGRLKTITNPAGSTDTTTYFVNALGQRVKKSGPATIVTSGINYYVYDDAGHLLGEYNASGKPLQETVYLGDTPVAVLTQSIAGTAPSQVTTTNLHYVYADHLGTARVITRATDNKMVWRWDNADPFGMLAPDGNPSQLGAFTDNPRFPGQVYDRESGLFYNYFRDYDPQTGRYVQSDPIGLEGGLNTFAYVEGNPISKIDPKGLLSIVACANPVNAAACAEAGIIARAAPIAFCPPESKKCTMASGWQLTAGGITDEHDFKEGWIGKKNGSKYDICACDDGSIVLRGRGKCGTSGPTIDTGSKWK
jgi:RHS repeat-associated protein